MQSWLYAGGGRSFDSLEPGSNFLFANHLVLVRV